MVRSLHLLCFLLSTSITTFAQVGIGTTTPHPSAQLDITSTDKGVLIPRLTTDQIKNLPTPTEGLLVYNLDAHEPCYYNGTRWLYYDKTAVLPKKIGESYEGGIIIYVDKTGLHGIVAASEPQDAMMSTIWGCVGNPVSIGTVTTIGSGQANTVTIINSCSGESAARICDNLVLNGYSDWYLPSYSEIDLVCAAYQYLQLPVGQYYSSSQAGSSKAYYLSVYKSSPENQLYCFVDSADKSTKMNVLAVRSF